jgi:hypothetical protein
MAADPRSNSSNPPRNHARNSVLLCAGLGLLFGYLWCGCAIVVGIALASWYAGTFDAFLNRPLPLAESLPAICGFLAACVGAQLGGIAGSVAGGTRLPRGRWRYVIFPSACGGAAGAVVSAGFGGIIGAMTIRTRNPALILGPVIGSGVLFGIIVGWLAGRVFAEWVLRRQLPRSVTKPEF